MILGLSIEGVLDGEALTAEGASMDLEFVRDIVPDEGNICVFTLAGGVPRNHFYSSLDAIRGSFSGDIYFAMASYATPSRRTAANAAWVGAFWVDLDAGSGKGYPSKSAALTALLEWCEQTDRPDPTHIVDSGNGLHAYWALDELLSPAEWKLRAVQLKAELAAGGIRADPVRTADVASVLRIPGTHNLKDPASPQLVRVLKRGGLVRVDELITPPSLPPLHLPTGGLPGAGVAVGGVLDVLRTDFPPASAAAVAQHCATMRAVFEVRGAVSEPLWRAALSIVSRCVNGDEEIHDWSRGDPRYSPDETAGKAARTTGPATCDLIRSLSEGKCDGCSAGVKSPILLGEILGSTATVGSPAPDEIFTTLNYDRTRVTPRGVQVLREEQNRQGEDVSTWVHVTCFPFWVVEVHERVRMERLAQDASSLVVRWIGIDGVQKDGLLPQHVLYEARAFTTWLANSNLRAQTFDVKGLTMAIAEMTREAILAKRVQQYYGVLGWAEGGFVLGTHMATEKGLVPVRVETGSPIRNLAPAPRANLSEWVRAANALSDPAATVPAFTLLAALASPLVSLMGVTSAALSLVGGSGMGKSLSAKFAVSAFGNPQYLQASGRSTANAVGSILATHRHVPFLWDEVTSIPLPVLAEFLYIAANGMDKSVLQRTREIRAGGEWALTAILTSNRAIMDQSEAIVQEAHRRRVMELRMDSALPIDVRDAMVTGCNHYGAAAEVLLQRVLSIGKDAVAARMKELDDEYQYNRAIPQEHRFVRWLLVAGLAAGEIARGAGLINWDPRPVVDKVVAMLAGQFAETRRDEDRMLELIALMTNEHRDKICFWSQHARVAPATLPREVAMRYDASRKTLMVSAAWFRTYLAEKGIGWTGAMNWMGGIDGIDHRKNGRLAPGSAPVSCVYLEPEKLGFPMEDLDTPGAGEISHLRMAQ